MVNSAHIGVAIVGVGIGSAHLAGYLEVADRFKVICVCDLNRELAKERIDAAGSAGIEVSDSIDKVLADERVQLVDVCLPPMLHVEVVKKAMASGKNVICEKPLGVSLAEIDEMSDAASGSGQSIFPVFQYRYGIGMRQLEAVLASGIAGEAFVATLETHWRRGADYYAVPWRGTWEAEGGGAVLGHAIHIHDLLCTLLGPVARVNAMLATRVNDIEVDDCAAVAFEMKSGALATSSVTLGAADDTSRLRICFENLTVTSGSNAYNPAGTEWNYQAKTDSCQKQLAEVIGKVPEGLNGYAGMFAEVFKALNGEENSAPTIAQARSAVELVTGFYASSLSGAAVELPLGAGHRMYRTWRPAS